MIITKRHPDELGTLYKAIFAKSFGTYIEHRDPDCVFLVESDDRRELIGFVSVFIKSKSEAYICYGGSITRGIKTVRAFSMVVEELHKTHQWISLNVENTNEAALKMAIHAKFNIIGTRVAVDGTVIVEFIKGAEQ